MHDLLSVWRAAVDPGDLSRHTTAARRGSADRLGVSVLATVRLDRLGVGDLDRFVRTYPGAVSTLRRDLHALRAAWSWGRGRALVPDRELPRARVRGEGRVYSDYTPTAAEVAAVLEVLARRKPWAWRAVYLLWATGARPREVASLTWDRVDLVAGTVTVAGKTGARTIPVAPDVVEELKTWPRRRATVTGVAVNTVATNLHVHLSAACVDANVPRIPPYGLRRHAVDAVYDTATDPSVAAALLGHSAREAIATYRRVRPAALAAAVERSGLGAKAKAAPVEAPPLASDEDALREENARLRAALSALLSGNGGK